MTLCFLYFNYYRAPEKEKKTWDTSSRSYSLQLVRYISCDTCSACIQLCRCAFSSLCNLCWTRRREFTMALYEFTYLFVHIIIFFFLLLFSATILFVTYISLWSHRRSDEESTLRQKEKKEQQQQRRNGTKIVVGSRRFRVFCLFFFFFTFVFVIFSLDMLEKSLQEYIISLYYALYVKRFDYMDFVDLILTWKINDRQFFHWSAFPILEHKKSLLYLGAQPYTGPNILQYDISIDFLDLLVFEWKKKYIYRYIERVWSPSCMYMPFIYIIIYNVVLHSTNFTLYTLTCLLNQQQYRIIPLCDEFANLLGYQNLSCDRDFFYL